MTAIIAEAIQDYMEENEQIPWEKKVNHWNSRGTNDQLLIDKKILRNSRRRKFNVRVAWIDCKKAYNSLPHSWITRCLVILDISSNIRQFL